MEGLHSPFLLAASALKCYECRSYESRDDCEDNRLPRPQSLLLDSGQQGARGKSLALRTRAQLPRVALQEPGKKRLWRRQDNRIKVMCLGSNRCLTAKISSINTSLVAHLKGCAKTCDPSDVPACQHPSIKCEVRCCGGDYCNAGPILMVSSVFIMLCALIAAALGQNRGFYGKGGTFLIHDCLACI